MLRKSLFVVGTALLATLGMGLGCRLQIGSHDPHHNEWVADHDHQHGAGCGHYRSHDRWYVAESGHVHRDGCGHHYRGGIWIGID